MAPVFGAVFDAADCTGVAVAVAVTALGMPEKLFCRGGEQPK